MSDEGKRSHRWYSPRNVILTIVAIIVATLGWMTWEVWQVYTAKPNPATNFRLVFRERVERLPHIVAGDKDGSWTKFKATISQASDIFNEIEARKRETDFIPRDVDELRVLDFDRIISTHPIPADIAREREALERLARDGIINSLSEVAQRPIGLHGTDGQGMMVLDWMSDLSQVRQLAKARTASMRLASMSGDEAAVTDAFDQLLAVSSTIAHQPAIVCALTGVSIDSMVWRELSYELMERPFGADACRRMLESLERHPMPPLQLILEGESVAFYDTVQHTYSDDGNGSGYMLANAVEPLSSRFKFIDAAESRFLFADRAALVKKYDSLSERCLTEATLPINSWWTGDFDPEIESERMRRRYLMVGLMLPAIAKSMHSIEITRMQREGMRLMLAIELYRANHQKYPESLDLLVPGIIPEIPRDSMHEGSFGYRRLANDAHGRGYLLYSYGFDGKDNNGTAITNADEVWLALHQRTPPNVDYVFTLPRPIREQE